MDSTIDPANLTNSTENYHEDPTLGFSQHTLSSHHNTHLALLVCHKAPTSTFFNGNTINPTLSTGCPVPSSSRRSQQQRTNRGDSCLHCMSTMTTPSEGPTHQLWPFVIQPRHNTTHLHNRAYNPQRPSPLTTFSSQSYVLLIRFGIFFFLLGFYFMRCTASFGLKNHSKRSPKKFCQSSGYKYLPRSFLQE